MKPLVFSVVLALSLGVIVCPPVTEKPSEEPAKDAEDDDDSSQVDKLAYEKYLREVMTQLMADTGFAKKMMDTKDLADKSADIAQHLEFVSHGVRTKLDEIKRKEVDRLRQLMRMQDKIKQGLKTAFNPISGIALETAKAFRDSLPKIERDKLMSHVDHKNPNTFEISDLDILIKQATTDLEDLDKERKKEFKNYELEKEHLRREKLKGLKEDERLAEEKRLADMEKKHADHPKLHHPGSKDQLEEVWEESDGLDKQDFDPKTFFFIHDTNGDGHLDENEIEALFQKELDKVYDPDAPEDDMMERYEEMSRMREHILNEVDKDGNKEVSLAEFLASTKDDDFEKDEGWDTLDNEEVFSDEELARFEQAYEERRKEMLAGENKVLVDKDERLHLQGNVNQMQQEMGQQGVEPKLGVPPVPQQVPQAAQPAGQPQDQPQQL